MLSRHPMSEMTHHGRSLAELVNERNGLVDQTQTGEMMNLSEEGHVFDHEPGMVDYHHDKYVNPEFEHH